MSIPTRFFVISDTHGDRLNHKLPEQIDVAIHCGDLTQESKLDEFRVAINLLKELNATIKIVIAGNHDWTMDIPMFKKKLAEHNPPLEDDLVKKEYGSFGKARALFETEDAKAAGIIFLDEGTHHLTLANGAGLTVYASPYTPSTGGWGFNYHPSQEHDWSIDTGVDVAITHSPPRGIMDYLDSRQRAGSPGLFTAIARARPMMHCFGHIHESWGAKTITWRDDIDDEPSHFISIDNDKSEVVENLAGITAKKFDTPDLIAEKEAKLEGYQQQGCCTVTSPPHRGTQTLFVNAAIEGPDESSQQLPWVVHLILPKDEMETATAGATTTITSKKRRLSGNAVDAGSPSKRAALGP